MLNNIGAQAAPRIRMIEFMDDDRRTTPPSEGCGFEDKTSPRRSAFFGRRKGHALRARQAGLMQSLLPRLALDLNQPAPARLETLFAAATEAVQLEIGFGGGEHLAAQAIANPTIGFIGCEPFVNGMAKMLAAIEDQRIPNVRLHFGDATELLDWLPATSLAGVDILYPDPWPKRRHWKRRIVQDQSVAALTRLLRPGSVVHFATDIADYAAWTLERFLRSPAFAWTAECADDWRTPWAGYVATRYEAKAKRESRVPNYFVFRRTDGA
jgi:tRNA (guanine-N7-)-methyltransferase